MQQINFYSLLPKSSLRALSFQYFCWLNGMALLFNAVITLLFLLILLGQGMHWQYLNYQQKNLEGKIKFYLTHSVKVKAALNIKQLMAADLEKIKEIDLLKLYTFRSMQYQLSPYLLALAKAIVPGIWLTSIQIDDRGQKIKLTGSASRPDLLPRYLSVLSDSKAFSKQAFRLIKITHTDDLETVNFILESP